MEKGNDSVRYEYRFKRHVDIDDIQDTLTLSILGAENLHGRSRLRLDGWWRLDRQRRVCLIDASTTVGADIAKLFTGYLSREFGESSFSLRRPASANEPKAEFSDAPDPDRLGDRKGVRR